MYSGRGRNPASESLPLQLACTRKTIGYEALARWQSEKFSLVSPDRFIGLAAQNGVLPRLTQQLANRALTYSAAMKARELPWKVSLNLGMEDFVDSALPEKLAALVARHGLPAHSLTVELTEFFGNPERDPFAGNTC